MPRKAQPDLTLLEQRIGHRFLDVGLLRLALTHVSATGKRPDSYQRLEFLGDRVLGLVVADMLYRMFPDAPEGDLSRRLAELVRRETCAEIALDWGVAAVVRLGEGEAQSGGAQKAAILGDVCEAILGAVHLDGGDLLRPHRTPPLRGARSRAAVVAAGAGDRLVGPLGGARS